MSFQKLAGIGGIVFAVLLVVNFVAPGSPEAADASAADIAKYLADNEGGIKFAQAAGILGTIPAIFWGVGIASRLRAAGGDGPAWGLVGLLGLIMSGVIVTVSGLLQIPFVVSESLLEDTVLLVNAWQLFYVLSAGVVMGLGVMFLGYCGGGLRLGVGARWLNGLGLLGAVCAVVGSVWPAGFADASPISYVGIGAFLIFILFTLVTGIEMVREAPAAQE
jgi:hypothetical protein